MPEFDPYSYDFHEDPYPIYKWLRDEAPAYWNERLRFWALSRHADVLAAFKDPARFSSAGGVSLERSSQSDPSAVAFFIAMDPPKHDKYRNLVSKAFTPRRIAELEPRIRALTEQYVDRFIDARRCDFIADFSAKLPMDVVSEMLGVPGDDRDTLRTWADLVLHREPGMSEVPPAGIEASGKLLEYFARLVAARRRQPGDDLTSALIAAELDGERLSDREVMAFLFLMIIAGNETTTKLLGNALYWIWRNPDQRRLLREGPAMIPRWVEETLRYDNSSQALARTLTTDVELHGRTLRAGDKVLLLIGAANRDERVFPDPDRFDLLRDHSESLSFGKGTHFCLGASLARLEGRVALEAVQRRFPDFEIDPAGLVRVHNPNVRGFASMPITF
ncbi:MAG TPA: cytochrome P450 [Candidatus Limnocylindria bacterium]|nr:cytochrome P450 [Candidatus Limnocylindria bacterium]